MPYRDLSIFAPELSLCGLAIAVLVADLIVPRTWRRLPAGLAAVGLVVPLYFVARLWPGPLQFEFMGAYAVDSFSGAFKILLLVAAFLVILLSFDYLRKLERGFGEYFALLLFSLTGMMLLTGAVDLIVIYLAFEMVSLSSYVLTGYMKRDPKSNEAELKYFLYGAAASGVMLYGISLVYGLGGSTRLAEIAARFVGSGPAAAVAVQPAFLQALLTQTGIPEVYVLRLSGLMLPLAIVLITVGLGFKIAMVPFHAWSPDAYEGAPTPITAFLSVGPKIAGFALLMRLVYAWYPALMPHWPALLASLATITMFGGNLWAIRQTNIKRMLAYSSIAHAGYLLIGVVVAATNPRGLHGIIVYFAAYLLMNLGAFAVILLVARNYGGEEISDFSGLSHTAPAAAAAMVIFLLSLTGIPPTGGFLGKFYIFGAAIGSGEWAWLAVVGIINSVISLYYYMNVARVMYFGKPRERAMTVRPASIVVVAIVCLVGILALGLFPQAIIELIQQYV